MIIHKSQAFLIAYAMSLVLACGTGGLDDSKGTGGLSGPQSDIMGSVTSQSGGQGDMAGWVLAMVEKESGIARVSEVDNAGLVTLKHASTTRTHTLVLLSPEYIMSAVLSVPGIVANTVRQYFTLKNSTLPRIIHNGSIITFQNIDGVSVQKDTAADADGNNIPDGPQSIFLQNEFPISSPTGGIVVQPPTRKPFFLQTDGSKVDIDTDGIPNQIDPDLDGDGIANWFDPDDDADSSLDIFDLDANGDLVQDSVQTKGDQYFSEGVEYIAAQFEMIPQTDGSNKSTLTFITKVRNDTTPLTVQIRGAANFINGSLVEYKDSEGNITPQTWDKRLMDDGISEDGTAGDRVFARKITLESGKYPRPYQVFFFQLAFGSKDNPWFAEYPFTFPNITPGSIAASFDSNLKRVQITGNPFGDKRDFVWTAILWDSEGKIKIHETNPLAGTTTESTFPTHIFETGKTYQYSVVARTLDKVPPFATYKIHSAKGTVQ